MKKILFIIPILALLTLNAIAGTTFSSKEVLTSTKLNQAFSEKHDVVSFNNYSTQMKSKLDLKQNKADIDSWVTKVVSKPDINPNSVTIPQKVAPQYFELLEGSAGGTNKVTITVPSTLNSDHSLVITDTGLTFDGAGISGSGVWGSITGTLSNQTDLLTVLNLKELTSNKSTATTLGTSNTLYPSQNAVKSYVDAQIAGVTVGAPITTVPTYSNDTCTKGQYAPDTSYLYFCKDTNTWDRIAFANWTNIPSSGPTFSSFTIGTTGTSLTAAMSAATSVGAGGSGGLSLSCTTAGTLSATYSSGTGTSSLVYTIPVVYTGDTCTASYTNPTNGLEGTSGGVDVANISGFTGVSNNSTATQSSSETLTPVTVTAGWTRIGSAGSDLIAATDSDDTTYFTTSSTSESISNYMPQPVGTGTIASVKLCARMRYATDATHTAIPTPIFKLYNGSTYQTFSPASFTVNNTEFADFCTNNMTTNPYTSAAFTKSDISTLSWRVLSGTTGSIILHAAKIWAIVNY